jgi:NADH-quinone oxidoreductase subunit M
MSLLLVLIPLLGAFIQFLVKSPKAKPLALGVSLLQLAATLFVLATFNADGSFHHEINLPWVESAGIHFRLGLDGISMLMVLLTSLLTPVIIATQGENRNPKSQIYGLILLMQTALTGVFMALDGLLFYIFYELALIPIYFICALWGGEDRVRVTLKFFIYTFFGSLLMLVALIYLYLQTPGNHSFALEALQGVTLSPEAATWVWLGFFIAFAVKLPIFPFHTWQPDTYTSAPTAGVMLLSGIMLKMGGYGLLRWGLPLAPEAASLLTPAAIGLAVIGVVYASIIAIRQTDYKRLIAYSSIAHVGLIAAGILAWNDKGLQGSLLQMLNHGINVVGLFFVCDILERRLGNRHLPGMGGIAKSAPRFAALFMIVMLGAVAVPLTNGFPGEFLLLQSVWTYNPWLGAAAGLTIIFGAVYMLRVYQLAMFGEANEKTAAFADLDQQETILLGGIAALVILLGFFPQPVLDLTAATVDLMLGK